MSFTYAVLGAGRQGTAAAFDLAVRGDASHVRMGAGAPGVARRSAERVNRLAGRSAAEPAQADVWDPASLDQALAGVECCLSAVPYSMNLEVTRAALRARAHL